MMRLMNRSSMSSLAAVALTFVCCPCLTIAATPADDFVESVTKDASVPQQAREFLSKAWAACDGCDGDEFLTQGLTILSPRFGEGLDAYDDDRYDECTAIMTELGADENAYVSINAQAYTVKALIAQENTIEAGARIKALYDAGAERITTYSYFAPELAFLKGYCELSDLQYDAAVASLNAFLETHADASERLRLSAEQMLAELGNRQPGRIGEVVDLMTFSGRRLKSLDSGKVV
ncbi:MAG: hypothetical protein ACPGXK_11200, partial [Phycisphaerae bacterium]